MYNRYIPQSDGTYRQDRVQEPRQRQQSHRPPPPPPPPRDEGCDEPFREDTLPCPPPQSKPRSQTHRGDSAPDFLRQLLPKDFDTGDLIVVLLLLLLAGDCPEDRSTALLTLALYLFM
jgi:hypothetical protein